MLCVWLCDWDGALHREPIDQCRYEQPRGRGVVAFRRWYHGKGQGGPPYFNSGQDVLPPASIPRMQLLDRWEQHTQHCPSCQKARELTVPHIACQLLRHVHVLEPHSILHQVLHLCHGRRAAACCPWQ